MKTFEKIYKTTVEPMLTYAIGAWYPSQIVLQNTIGRVQKFAAKLQRLHLFVPGTARETTMEARQPSCNGETCTGHAQSHPGPPETTRSSRHAMQRHNRRRTRTGHELELIIPVSKLEVVTSSSLNTWNNLPADVATIADPIRFKNVVKGHAVYNLLTNTKTLEDRN